MLFHLFGYGALTFSAKDKQLARVVLKEDSELLDEVVVIGLWNGKEI